MDVAAGTGCGRVHVGMRIDPDHAQLFAPLEKVSGNAGNRADGERMIAAENQRTPAGDHLFLHELRKMSTGLRDLRKILSFWLSFRMTFRLRHRDVAEILNFVADFAEPGIQIRDANRGRAHVDAATSRTEIERNTDD